MHILEVIILGAIQGLTEFIPISSSGHLIAIPFLFGWQYLGKSFDVAMHLGTLVAVIIYFRRDWAAIISDFTKHIVSRKPYSKDNSEENSGKLLVPILIACVPAALVGFFFDDFIEKKLSVWYFVAPAMIVFGFVMLLAERMGKKQRAIGKMCYVDYLMIGCAQALALFPGVSRSGITISAGLFRGLDRAASARFSFLLSTPIILGAGLLKLKDILEAGLPCDEVVFFAVGFVTAAVFGYAAIRFLMNYLRNKPLDAFVWYRFCFAVLMVAVFLIKK